MSTVTQCDLDQQIGPALRQQPGPRHEKVAEIRRLRAAGHTVNSIAARFGVHQATISRASRGESWS